MRHPLALGFRLIWVVALLFFLGHPASADHASVTRPGVADGLPYPDGLPRPDGPGRPDGQQRDEGPQYAEAPRCDEGPRCAVRSPSVWLLSTRHLSGNPCVAELDSPSIRVHRLGECRQLCRESMEMFLGSRDPSRPCVIYVHGNRMDPSEALRRGLLVRQQVLRRGGCGEEVDWVIWSWPSEKRGILAADARHKAWRTNVEGLYLGWLLGRIAESGQPTSLVGYSFGARILSGSLHALAGGSLGGRSLPQPPLEGVPFRVGMIAPALESDWLSARGYHRLATKNLESLTLLYNRRDAVLRNYWRIDRIRNADALGYTGPTSFAPRHNGSGLPVRSRDCGAVVGFHHDELSYYEPQCDAGREIAVLIRTEPSEP